VSLYVDSSALLKRLIHAAVMPVAAAKSAKKPG